MDSTRGGGGAGHTHRTPRYRGGGALDLAVSLFFLPFSRSPGPWAPGLMYSHTLAHTHSGGHEHKSNNTRIKLLFPLSFEKLLISATKVTHLRSLSMCVCVCRGKRRVREREREKVGSQTDRDPVKHGLLQPKIRTLAFFCSEKIINQKIGIALKQKMRQSMRLRESEECAIEWVTLTPHW